MDYYAMLAKNRPNQEYLDKLWTRLAAAGGKPSPAGKIARAIYAYNAAGHDREQRNTAYRELWQLLAAAGKPLNQIETVDELLMPALKSAIELLVGKDDYPIVAALLRLRAQGQFSFTLYRRAYRTKRVGPYIPLYIDLIWRHVEWQSKSLTMEQVLKDRELHGVSGFGGRLAVAIWDDDPAICPLVEEALLGDNVEVSLTQSIISAIVVSGNPHFVQLLGKLLLAARLQEGLRQSILEKIDMGSVETMAYFLNLIVENNLIRYSSVVRALDTWAGLGFSGEKPAVVEKCARLALRALTQPSDWPQLLQSGDVLELYFGLWGMANHDLDRAREKVFELVDSREKYVQLVALYFITQTDSEAVRHETAIRFLDCGDDETLAWVVANLAVSGSIQNSMWSFERGEYTQSPSPNPVLPKTPAERQRQFDQLAQTLKAIGNKKRTFEHSVFPWTAIILSCERVMGCMMSLAIYDLDNTLLDRLAGYAGYMSADQRGVFVAKMIGVGATATQRRFLRESLADKSARVRGAAVRLLESASLNAEDITSLTGALAAKSGKVRKDVITLLLGRPDALLGPAMADLLSSQDEAQVAAGLELAGQVREKGGALPPDVRRLMAEHAGAGGEAVPEDAPEATETYTPENGFGLFDPGAAAFTPVQPPPPAEKKGVVARLLGGKEAASHPAPGLWDDARLKAATAIDKAEADRLNRRMTEVLTKYADYEYLALRWDGSPQKVLLGNQTHSIFPLASSGKKPHDATSINDYPLAEAWAEAAGEYASDYIKLSAALSVTGQPRLWGNGKIESWFQKRFSGYLAAADNQMPPGRAGQYWAAHSILNVFLRQAHSPALFAHAFTVYRSLVAKMPADEWMRPYFTWDNSGRSGYNLNPPRHQYAAIDHPYLAWWRNLAKQCANEDADFTTLFTELWNEYLLCERKLLPSLTREDFFRAHSLGIIPPEVIYEQLTTGPAAGDNLRNLTGKAMYGRWLHQDKKTIGSYPFAQQAAFAVAERVVGIEEKRGELDTPASPLAAEIGRFYGAMHFVRLLAALGKEDFYRGYAYSFSAGSSTKKQMLSRLLKVCYPAKDEAATELASLLKNTGISDKRLAQAALYAPQWAGLVEDVTGWKGLKCGVWFFHAHTSEYFSAEKETEVALYSPITAKQFNDGAFDPGWFFKAYETLGEERFGLLYKYAKYITGGNVQHRRAQLYADAVLGKLDIQKLEAEITEKRGQDKLRCYPLLPIEKDDAREALRRYEFIQRFAKESKQFGAQRRDSEGKAARTALDNLAISTGYFDVDRMTWALEGEKLESIRPLMEPAALGEVSVRLAISEEGVPSVAAEKGGNPLKSIPKAVAKEKNVVLLKETVSELKSQRSRAKESFERAMVNRSEFTGKELAGLLQNPLLSPYVARLVWRQGENMGLPQRTDGRLVLQAADGETCPIDEKAGLCIAHPHDMLEGGCWGALQKHLFQNEIVQPFKQVFREYYPLTQDEKEAKTFSRRYDGYQVQPGKTVALLKTRGWTVDYEQGLQKVLYADNLVASLYALADWFSPADIEAPTLETIQFYHRDRLETADLNQIPPIVFSEVMRDIDLVVSVAHVGGVDPEASHSTVEMRVAIARELSALLKIQNVAFSEAHAKIKGTLGNYSVHMGSGVVHQQAAGMLAILPVHSQARGRLFLPFADDDPKTAEVMSKILLLSEDGKIKDPSILEQIRNV